VEYRVGVSDLELASLYQRAWIYASPSTYEGFGLPYLEAMACGTPVVATPNSGSDEVLGRGGSGVLASDADFAQALSSLLADNQARDRLAARGLERARDYSLSAMLTRYEEFLFELVTVDAKRVASV
jgi:glycosyltransferase involved in cell wall biosynthesis